MSEEEHCPKCGSKEFLVARDCKATRNCRCGETWTPYDNEKEISKLKIELAHQTDMACQADIACSRMKEELSKTEGEVIKLKSFIAQSIPFLKEAWTACFDGQKEKLLSCEQRGMGELIYLFQAIADGKPVLPPGVITSEENSKQVERATQWANDLLGNPNDLKDPFKQYVSLGETCADGLKKAHAKRVEAEAKIESLKDFGNQMIDLAAQLSAVVITRENASKWILAAYEQAIKENS